MTRIIDSDTHFMEPASIYREYIDPKRRELALYEEKDDRGWPWLRHKDRRLMRIDHHTPGHPELIGEQQSRYAAGAEWLPPESEIPDAWEAAARVANLADHGVDASFVFPNLGLGWEEQLSDDLVSLGANQSAYNRWMLERIPDYAEQIYPAALLNLRDLDRFEAEIARCARGGCKLAMIAPQPIGGRALAHPDFDRAWAAFQDHDMAVCFHVSNIQLPLHPAWYALDPVPVNKLMDTAFLYLAPAVALASLICHGKLEQFPRLRIGVVELSAGWVPGFLMHLDGAYRFYESQRGRSLAKLEMPPSGYFKRQVRVNALPMEGAANLMEIMDLDLFMWGSDYPHAEGMKEPSWSRYLKVQPRRLAPEEQVRLAGGNAAFLLGE